MIISIAESYYKCDISVVAQDKRTFLSEYLGYFVTKKSLITGITG